MTFTDNQTQRFPWGDVETVDTSTASTAPSSRAVSVEKDEDWRSVRDSTHRRRIQNRLAQRNYRKKRKDQQEQQQRSQAAENASPFLLPSATPATTLCDPQASLPARSIEAANSQLRYFYERSPPAFSPLPDLIATPEFQRDVQFTIQYQKPNFITLPDTPADSPPFDLSKSLESYDNGMPTITLAEIENPEGPPSEDSWSEDGQNVARSAKSYQSSTLSDPLSKDFNAKATGGLTALQSAAFFGHDHVVSLLLNKGADIEGANATGLTALHIAATQGCHNTVKLLLSRGACPTPRDRYGRTPLHLAAQYGHSSTVWDLLENGSHMEAVDQRGSTALHVAAHHGRQPVVRLLLERGSKVNAKDASGRTALHRAAERGHETVVRLLLDKGVDINAKTEGG